MYGIDPTTRQCVYKTPCGWCARLEQECKIDCKNQSRTPTGYKLCIYYKNGRCIGTKEMESCKEYQCDHITFE